MATRNSGEWITVSEYAKIMGITPQRVYQRIWQGTLEGKTLRELSAEDPDTYKRLGRGPSGSCSIVVWLADDDDGKTRRK